MPRAFRNAALAGAISALSIVAGFVVVAVDDDGVGFAWTVADVLVVAGSIGLFLVPVVLQVRQAMTALRALRASVIPVLGVTAFFVLAASAVFALAILTAAVVTGGGPEPESVAVDVDGASVLELVLWWWPLAVSAAVVVAVTEAVRRGVRRWAASRRSRAAAGNGSA